MTALVKLFPKENRFGMVLRAVSRYLLGEKSNVEAGLKYLITGRPA
jgi:hypothetical protein